MSVRGFDDPGGDSSFHDRTAGVLARGEESTIAKEAQEAVEPVKDRKGDPSKQYDVLIEVIHDNRKGISRAVQRATRYSFVTEEEAVAFAERLKEAKK